MKVKKRIFCGFLLLLCCSFTGCGVQLFELTDEEESMIVLYSAKIVSKYNRAQDTGYCYVEETEEEDAPEEVKPEEDVESEEPVHSFTDIIDIEGLRFEYQGYDVATDYSTADIVLPSADEGYSYLILHILVTNTTDQEMQVDLLSDPISYTLSLNDGVSAECISTLSMEDLSTYYNSSFGAQATDDAVLLFQIKTEYLQEITGLALQVVKQGQTYNVILQ